MVWCDSEKTDGFWIEGAAVLQIFLSDGLCFDSSLWTVGKKDMVVVAEQAPPFRNLKRL
jgi:uncharacterized protein with GYD domain